MNSLSLETEYIALTDSLQTAVGELLVQCPLFGGFWERWCKEHLRITRVIASGNFSPRDSDGPEQVLSGFLKQRQRMVSALAQGLKTNNSESSIVRDDVKNLLRIHDEQFTKMLNGQLETLKEKMNQAFALKKTVKAYAKTAQY